MSYEEAIDYIEKYECLPLCEHGNHLIDWGRDLLSPPCGCSLTKDALDGANCPVCEEPKAAAALHEFCYPPEPAPQVI